MDIVCASDSGFVSHMATMLLSLAENNREEGFRIFVLSDGTLPGEDQIHEMLSEYSVSISFSSISDYLNGDFDIKRGHFTKQIYARLLMDRILPPDVERAIYLDCDLIVSGRLKPLWRHSLFGRTVGAVPDPTPYAYHSLLGLPAGAPYFNSGVLLIDLERWRERGIGEKALEFARSHPDRLQWPDQCALNLILHDDWTPLDKKWNLQTAHISTEEQGLVRFKRIPAAERDSIKIVHFSGISKPWHYLNYHPMKADYLKYRQRTPWPLERFEDWSRRNVLRRFAYRRLPIAVSVYRGVESLYRGGS